jgi:hypothetical protein
MTARGFCSRPKARIGLKSVTVMPKRTNASARPSAAGAQIAASHNVRAAGSALWRAACLLCEQCRLHCGLAERLRSSTGEQGQGDSRDRRVGEPRRCLCVLRQTRKLRATRTSFSPSLEAARVFDPPVGGSQL